MSSDSPKPSDFSSDEEENRSETLINEVENFDLVEKLHFLSLNREKLIKTNSIKSLAEYIIEKNCKNIIVMTGAGISVAAGIPDFRSPRTGLYDNLAKYDLPYPEAVFDIKYFSEKPEPFYHLVKELYPANIKPTFCHLFVKLLHEKGLLLRNFTQNIDSLELLADIPDEKLVFAHGSFKDCHCIKCQKIHDSQWAKEIIFNDKIPRCTDCNSLVKPSIVFFGENLPKRFFDLAEVDFPKCDLLIIIGTSLKVYPFAGLAHMTSHNSPRVLINYTNAGTQILNNEITDIFLQGDCQQLIEELVKELGWDSDFDKLVQKYMHISTEPLKSKEDNSELNKSQAESDIESGSSNKDKPNTEESKIPFPKSNSNETQKIDETNDKDEIPKKESSSNTETIEANTDDKEPEILIVSNSTTVTSSETKKSDGESEVVIVSNSTTESMSETKINDKEPEIVIVSNTTTETLSETKTDNKESEIVTDSNTITETSKENESGLLKKVVDNISNFFLGK